jgi:hypothetical protein
MHACCRQRWLVHLAGRSTAYTPQSFVAATGMFGVFDSRAFATPQRGTPTTFPGDDEECRKLLLAELLGAPAAIEFDNLTGELLAHKGLCPALSWRMPCPSGTRWRSRSPSTSATSSCLKQ